MLKPVKYKSNSIIYFTGDLSDNIYVLKSGSVILKYQDIETGEELKEVVANGEFFGARSALGKYPREDTAFVVRDAETLVLTVPEFEELILKNTRILMKMLKVFSNQLRRIHKKLGNLMSTDENKSPEEGLFEIGNYYQQCGKNVQAVYAYRRYLIYHPAGKFVSKVQENLQKVEILAQNEPQKVEPQHETVHDYDDDEFSDSVSEISKDYFKGVKLLNKEKFSEAIEVFKDIISNSTDKDFIQKSQLEIGRCLYFLEKYDYCIKHFSTMIKEYPKHQDLPEAIYYVAASYTKKGYSDKATGFYKKILSITKEDSSLYKKTIKALAEIEG